MAAAQTQTEDEKLAAELAAQDLNAVPEGAADDQGSKLKQLLVRPPSLVVGRCYAGND